MPPTCPGSPSLRTIRRLPPVGKGVCARRVERAHGADARSHIPSRCCVCRLCQARLRQAGEQYVAETGRSTPTVQDVPHSGQLDVTPAWTASVLARARRIRRQCRDRHTDEQNTAAVFAAGISGPPHPRHNRGPASSSLTTASRSRGTLSLPIRAPYERHRLPPTPHIGRTRPIRRAPGQHRFQKSELTRCLHLVLQAADTGRPSPPAALPCATPKPPPRPSASPVTRVVREHIPRAVARTRAHSDTYARRRTLGCGLSPAGALSDHGHDKEAHQRLGTLLREVNHDRR